MSAQLDMFGGVAPAAKPSAAKKKSPYPTCWDSCLLCGRIPLSYHGKVFRTCTHPGNESIRCYEGDVICQKASLPRPVDDPSRLKVSTGWSDF